MKKIKTILAAALCACLALGSQSCLKDEERIQQYPAIVTVNPGAEGITLQLNDTITLNAVNLKPEYYKKATRAYTVFSFNDKASAESPDGSDITVHALDTIRTKLPVESLGVDNDKTYGADRLEIIRDWVTIGEDGYLTLRVRTLRSYYSVNHILNLVHIPDADEPNTYELRHDANGDTLGEAFDGLIAFDLNALAPEDGSPVTLNLKWKGFETDNKEAEFKLTFRRK